MKIYYYTVHTYLCYTHNYSSIMFALHIEILVSSEVFRFESTVISLKLSEIIPPKIFRHLVKNYFVPSEIRF